MLISSTTPKTSTLNELGIQFTLPEILTAGANFDIAVSRPAFLKTYLLFMFHLRESS
jgi:hypothetical protein